MSIGLSTDDKGDELTQKMYRYHHDMCVLKKDYFLKPLKPAHYASAFVCLGKERLPEVADRLFALRNWLIEISREDMQKTVAQGFRLFQMDLAMIPCYDENLLQKFAQS